MDFKTLRENLGNLITEIKRLISTKSVLQSSEKLKEAKNLLISLGNIAQGEIQTRVISRLKMEIGGLEEQQKIILSKRESGKKEDGNLAFKCNWNDKHYKAPCTNKVYEFNVSQQRAWCSSPGCKCRGWQGEVTMEKNPCYESIALKEMYFGAGWDHKGEKIRPRHIYSVRKDKVALLTTTPPGTEEKDRLIIGCLYINTVQDDPGEETKIYGDKGKSFEVDYDVTKIHFWDYYKNAKSEQRKEWHSGLFRYIADKTVLDILKGIGEKYTNSGKDTGKIIDLIKYYEGII